MAGSLDLLLQGRADGALQASLASGDGLCSFALQLPPALQQAYGAWRHRFLAHHGGGAVSAEVLQHYSSQLLRLLREWLQQPAWQPLQQALSREPKEPLRLRFAEVPPWLEQLPWEALTPAIGRPLWRLAERDGAAPADPPAPRRLQRQPRLLLLVGDETGLSLQAEIESLQRLQRRGRLQLTLLRGPACNQAAIRGALGDGAGWDGLIFLGHSAADATAGGRLQLGDGSWLTADVLQADLQQAARLGLALVLLSSCSGLDLARSAVAAGCSWAVCFREPVPCAAASLAFRTLLMAMERGALLQEALAEAEERLEQQGPVSTALLLSLLAAPTALPCRLPLRRRRQLQLRLSGSSRAQALAAIGAVALAGMGALVPWNPLSTYLLDRRLLMQQQWRLLTDQQGPPLAPIAVLLIDPHSSSAAPPPAAPADGSAAAGRLSRRRLAEILQRTPPAQVPRLGLDVVLDRPSPDDAHLAAVLRQQRRQLVVSGWFGPEAAVPGSGTNSQRLPPRLQGSGLVVRQLEVNTPGRLQGGAAQPLPLRLQEPLNAAHFAGALSGRPAPLLPAEAVIDWSLPWQRLLQRVEPEALPQLAAEVLVVGSNGLVDPAHPDLFVAPGAAAEALALLSGGSRREVPGALVQAALTQTIGHRLWLTPLPLLPITALFSGLGVVLAAALESRRWRLAVLALAWLVVVPLALQLAVSSQLLWPLLLPLLALSATALLRRG